MPQPRRTRASAPAWCVALYFLITSALGCTALGLLEGPIAVMVTCLGLAGVLGVLLLIPGELTMIANAFRLIVVILLVPAVAIASPYLSDVVRWVVAFGAASLILCLLIRVPVDGGQWDEAVNLDEPCGYVAAPWTAHALWIGNAISVNTVACAAAGALWHLAQLHWLPAASYGVSGVLASLVLICWVRLQDWLITDAEGKPTRTPALTSR